MKMLRGMNLLAVLILGACAQGSDSVTADVATATPLVEDGRNAEAYLLGFADDAPQNEAAFLRAVTQLYSSDPSVVAWRTRGSALSDRARSMASPIRPNVGISGRTIGGGDLTLQITQPLLDFGRRSSEVARFSAASGLAEQNVAAARSEILAELFSTIEEARHARDLIELHTRQIAEYREAQRAAQNLVSLNLATAADLRLAEVERQGAEVARSRAQARLSDAELRWRRLMGAIPMPRHIDARALRRATGTGSLSLAQAVADERAIELRHLLATRQLQAAEIETIRLARRPTVSAAAAVALDGDDESTGLGLTLDFPLYRRGLQEDLAEAQREIPAIDAEIANVRRNVDTAIARAETRAQTALQLAAQQDESVTLLRGRIEDVEYRVQSGLALYTDVIEARVDMFDAELSALESRADARIAETEILLLSGVLVP